MLAVTFARNAAVTQLTGNSNSRAKSPVQWAGVRNVTMMVPRPAALAAQPLRARRSLESRRQAVPGASRATAARCACTCRSTHRSSSSSLDVRRGRQSRTLRIPWSGSVARRGHTGINASAARTIARDVRLHLERQVAPLCTHAQATRHRRRDDQRAPGWRAKRSVNASRRQAVLLGMPGDRQGPRPRGALDGLAAPKAGRAYLRTLDGAAWIRAQLSAA